MISTAPSTNKYPLVVISHDDALMCEDAATAVEHHRRTTATWMPLLETALDSTLTRSVAFGAELAVARYLGLADPIWELGWGDGGVDLTLDMPLPDGDSTIQVKYRRVQGKDMALEGLDFWKELRADLYVLTQPGLLPRNDGSVGYELVGWCRRADWFHRVTARPPIWMHGRKYEMMPRELQPLSSLRAAILDQDTALRALGTWRSYE